MHESTSRSAARTASSAESARRWNGPGLRRVLRSARRLLAARLRSDRVRFGLMVLGVLALVMCSFPLGRYPVSPGVVLKIIGAQFLPIEETWTATEETVVLEVRLPRIIGALLVGAALSAAGSAYQSMFRNPLVSPSILGVSAGAGFGAALGILVGLPWGVVQLLAFGFGITAAVIALLIANTLSRGSLVVLVLGGIVVGSVFSAFISITQFFANPLTTLQTITFWLMGGLDRIRLDDLPLAAAMIGGCLLVLYLARWQVNVLAAGHDEAQTLGVNRRLVWVLVIGSATLMTATAVSLAGIVGWIGLVVPHLARFVVGPAFNRLFPAAVLLGAGFLLAVDDVARTAPTQLPLGVVTALIGAPFFVFLLGKARKQWL